MPLYNTPMTVELLKKHNRIFFSKESVKFHGDTAYRLNMINGVWLLTVEYSQFGRRGTVTYMVNPENYSLQIYA